MRVFSVLIGFLLLVSCAALPAIRQQEEVGGKKFECPSPFLREKTRLIHAIEVHAAGQPQTVMMGVTLADPAFRSLSCALMSAEGMVLLEASLNSDGLRISRALPPFAEGDFIRKMMEDIELIFFAPQGDPVQKGVFSGGEPVCRWHSRLSGWIDASAGRDGSIVIRNYAENGGLRRSVQLDVAAHPYAIIELHAFERIPYSLVMTLIESEAVHDDALQQKKSQGGSP